MFTDHCPASQVCLGCLVACSAAGSTPPQAGAMQNKGRTLVALRGGEGFRPSKLQRTYSMSGIVPPAADPTHLEADMSSGEMDMHMKTARFPQCPTHIQKPRHSRPCMVETVVWV